MKKSRRTLLAVLVMLLTCTFPGSAQEGPQLADTLVGGEVFYTVQLGDTLTSIRVYLSCHLWTMLTAFISRNGLALPASQLI